MRGFKKGSNNPQYIHGHYRDPTHNSWSSMIDRCSNPNATHFNRYGGRGIKVCKRWQIFKNFLDDMGERPVRMTLERINNNRGYCKANCRWATRQEQARNRKEKRTRGTRFHKGAYEAYITVSGKFIHLGRFPEQKGALKARSEAERQYWR